MKAPCVLAVGGLDPGGGAGILADARAIVAAGAFPCAVVAVQTIQSTRGLARAEPVDARLWRAQAVRVLDDQRVRALKLGALGSVANVRAAAKLLASRPKIPAVVDPVMLPTSGAARLLDASALGAVKRALVPRAALVTANAREAEALTGLRVRNAEDAGVAARAIVALGARAALVKGGHLEKPVDVLFDGTEAARFEGERVRGENTHGSGCTLSSAIAAQLAQGKHLHEAVLLAKVYVQKAMERAYPIGKGPGPLNHFFRAQAESATRGVHAEELHPVQVPPSER